MHQCAGVWTQFVPQLVANVGRSVMQWRDLVVEDRAPDEQQNLTRAAMVQSLTLAVQPAQHCSSPTARWQMQRRVLQQHHVQVNDESVVDVECGRSMLRRLGNVSRHAQLTLTVELHPKSRIAASADTIVASPTTTSFSDDDSDWSAVDEPYHNRSVLPAFNCRPLAPNQSTTSFQRCTSVVVQRSHSVSEAR